MSIQTLNLLARASASLLPAMTRTGSIPAIVGLMSSLIPPGLTAFSWLDQYLRNEYSPFYSKCVWYLLPESLTLGHFLSQFLAQEILGKETTLLADVGVLAGGAIGSFRLLQIGMRGKDHTLDIPYTSLAQRAVFGVIGIAGIAQVVDAIKNRILGLFAFQSLDPEQQYFVLKHRSIETLGGPVKNCRAVIIDGSSSEWGGRIDDLSWPLAEELYRNCEVRTYRVDPNSTVPVCDAAEKGKKALGGPVDILALLGHGNQYRMTLKKGTDFRGSSDETACLKEHLQPDAQMILAGCNTATGNNSLTEKVSRHLNGIEVTGFSAYFTPLFCTTSWDGRKLSFWSYFPRDSQGNWIFPWTNTARTFKSMPSNEPQDVFRGVEHPERGP